ncbi:alkanesulfonate monooxygenase [Verrucomicrobium sp. GAS474]|uniref:LLM class flavin-dependent oxidoreductase n=1 Tax=Verrucomicrobium sp. GAS474 TaxID=1882831 RepID=UPI00087D7C87|nr:LLM class flavin-dependent oxidoreductase [Verrucomicrobium sp. GAS474]SDT97192.1 alkanesulfonate monooxygenase [Verrucomicrobium sp. GAS474]
MSLQFHWFLPTYGDSRYIVGGGHGLPAGVAGGARPANLDYLGQIARSAEQLGYVGALTPTGAWCEDAFIVDAMLASVTKTFKFLVAVRPGLISPTLAAQMAATFQRHSDNRLLLNVVVGGEPVEQRAYADFSDKSERYERADEFLQIVRALWERPDVNFQGRFYQVENATLPYRPDVIPPLYIGGSSAGAGPVTARHIDSYLTWGEPTPAVAKKIEWIRGLAAAEGRRVRFGIRLHVISRDTPEAAWAEASRLLSAIDPETIRQVQAGLARSEGEGQRRMLALHNGSTANLEIEPNLWAGFGLVRGGCGTALVGSHAEIAAKIKAYAALGIEEFVLSGVPHLEEAYWFAEGVLPLLQKEGLWSHPQGPAAASCVPNEIPFAASTSRKLASAS